MPEHAVLRPVLDVRWESGHLPASVAVAATPPFTGGGGAQGQQRKGLSEPSPLCGIFPVFTELYGSAFFWGKDIPCLRAPLSWNGKGRQQTKGKGWRGSLRGRSFIDYRDINTYGRRLTQGTVPDSDQA